MATVTIKSIGSQYIASVDDYIWLLEHRDEPLALAIIGWDTDGEVDYFVVRIDDRRIIVVFPDGNKVKYEVNYNA